MKKAVKFGQRPAHPASQPFFILLGNLVFPSPHISRFRFLLLLVFQNLAELRFIKLAVDTFLRQQLVV